MFAISHCVHVRCCNISAMTAFRSKSTFWPPFRFKLVGMLSFGNILVVIERFFIMLLSLRFFGFGNSSFVARHVTVVTETTIVELVDTVYCYFRLKQDYFDWLQSTIHFFIIVYYYWPFLQPSATLLSSSTAARAVRSMRSPSNGANSLARVMNCSWHIVWNFRNLQRKWVGCLWAHCKTSSVCMRLLLGDDCFV